MMKREKEDRINDSGENGVWQDGDPFRVAEWIAASLAGELTGEEEKELAEWKDRSGKNRRLYERVLNEENRRLKKEQFDSFSKESGWEGYRRKQRRERRVGGGWIRFARYAAVLLIPLCVALNGRYARVAGNGKSRDRAGRGESLVDVVDRRRGRFGVDIRDYPGGREYGDTEPGKFAFLPGFDGRDGNG